MILKGYKYHHFPIDKEAAAKLKEYNKAEQMQDLAIVERRDLAQAAELRKCLQAPTKTCWPHGYAETACEGLAIEQEKPCNFIIDGGLATERPIESCFLHLLGIIYIYNS